MIDNATVSAGFTIAIAIVAILLGMLVAWLFGDEDFSE